LKHYSFDKIQKRNYFRYSQGRSVRSIRYRGCKIDIAVTGSKIYRTPTVYDNQGHVWKSIVKVGDDIRTTEYKYDMFGNITETIQPDGTTIGNF
jgi:YD repeat-containing protein